MKLHPRLESFAAPNRFSSITGLYLSSSIFPSALTNFKSKLPHIMKLPQPYFSVELLCSGWFVSVVFLHSRCITCKQQSSVFVLTKEHFLAAGNCKQDYKKQCCCSCLSSIMAIFVSCCVTISFLPDSLINFLLSLSIKVDSHVWVNLQLCIVFSIFRWWISQSSMGCSKLETMLQNLT